MSAAQRRAADPSGSAWVTASAGTGKTKVLTDRVLRLLLEATPPERILCITYTKAAAAEMALRINETLAQWASAEQAGLFKALAALTGETPEASVIERARGLLAAVLDAPGGMKIQTIHAFCQSLLRRFPMEAGIAPHFEVADERDTAEMLESALQSLLIATRDDPALASALEEVTSHVGERDFHDVMAALAGARNRLARLLRYHGEPDALIGHTYRRLGVERGSNASALIEAACRDDAFDGVGLSLARGVLSEGSGAEKERADAIKAWLEAAPEQRPARLDSYMLVFLTQKLEPRKNLITSATAGRAPDAARVLEDECQRLLALNEKRRSLELARSTAALVTLGAALIDRFENEKTRRARLDYDDQILFARDLLTEAPGAASWVLYKLDGGIDHILIDEAQDTAPEQWQVIAALAEEFFAGAGARGTERTLFVVGDEKQSIFSFQGAEPRALEGMRRHFAEKVKNAGKKWREVPLELSFRSTRAVLRAVDAVFAEKRAHDGVALSGAAIRHEAHRKGQAGLVELWPPVGPRPRAPAPAWAPPLERRSGDSPPARLARRIARQIATWLDEGERLPARARVITPGDVMVLVRRRTGFVEELVRALKQLDIPVAGVDRMVLTEQIAVMDLIALGEFLLLPEDDLTLATLLKCPLIGFDEDALFALAHDRDEKSLWRCLTSRRAERPDFNAAHGFLAKLLARADITPPFELYAEVLGTLGGRRALLARLGWEADDPIDEFLSLALDYQRRQTPSLQGFLHWLGEGRAEIKRDLEQGGDAVRVMTVHGAKGLQAPIVFLPETLQAPSPRETILWPEGEPGDEILLWPGRVARDDRLSRAAREAARRRVAEEYRRLLYVAMTRAEDRLYLCGWRTKREPSPDCWYNLIEEALAKLGPPVAFDFTADGPEGWAGPGYRIRGRQGGEPRPERRARRAGAPAGLPEFARRPAPSEPASPRPLSPSRAAPEEPPARSPLEPANGFMRGRLIHRLLEILPGLRPERRAMAAERYLARPGLGLDAGDAREIAESTCRLLEDPEFAPLFGANGRAEVPLAALVSGRLIAGQVDRLVVGEEEVLILDYKTNRKIPARPEDVPAAYLAQMASYRAVLRRIFPKRRIRAALLWTDGPVFMALEDALLDPHTP
ncbi:MAG: double-strand break repair helicase AddA [Alphaproteobacteria bacterium]